MADSNLSPRKPRATAWLLEEVRPENGMGPSSQLISLLAQKLLRSAFYIPVFTVGIFFFFCFPPKVKTNLKFKLVL